MILVNLYKYNKKGNVNISETVRCVPATIVTVEKQ